MTLPSRPEHPLSWSISPRRPRTPHPAKLPQKDRESSSPRYGDGRGQASPVAPGRLRQCGYLLLLGETRRSTTPTSNLRLESSRDFWGHRGAVKRIQSRRTLHRALCVCARSSHPTPLPCWLCLFGERRAAIPHPPSPPNLHPQGEGDVEPEYWGGGAPGVWSSAGAGRGEGEVTVLGAPARCRT